VYIYLSFANTEKQDATSALKTLQRATVLCWNIQHCQWVWVIVGGLSSQLK